MAQDSESVGSRFTTLLDADEDELTHRLRQAVALAAGASLSLDWAALYDDLRWWGHPDKHVQQRWARAFFQGGSATVDPNSHTESHS
jgi:CRISPR system Cascade subunit CasB